MSGESKKIKIDEVIHLYRIGYTKRKNMAGWPDRSYIIPVGDLSPTEIQWIKLTHKDRSGFTVDELPRPDPSVLKPIPYPTSDSESEYEYSIEEEEATQGYFEIITALGCLQNKYIPSDYRKYITHSLGDWKKYEVKKVENLGNLCLFSVFDVSYLDNFYIK